ncbi:MAG: hypothetical protein M9922_01440 [Microthrixaceae bacterium]|nr:hypothetical protein [Microthrixaceae bacterium]
MSGPVTLRCSSYAGVIVPMVLLVALAMPGGTDAMTVQSVTPGPAVSGLVDAVDESVENNIGEPVLTLNNDNPTTWLATDGSNLSAGEQMRYPVYSYELLAESNECASYDLQVTMEVTLNGPDVGLNDNMFLFLVGDDDAFGGSSHAGPASVGSTTEMEASLQLTGAQMAEPVTILYGATTYQTPGIQTGYTLGEPTVDLTEDLAECDLDGDDVPDDEDPDNTDVCVPDPESTACVESRTTTPVESTTTTEVPTPTTEAPTTQPQSPPPTSAQASPAALRPTG